MSVPMCVTPVDTPLTYGMRAGAVSENCKQHYFIYKATSLKK